MDSRSWTWFKYLDLDLNFNSNILIYTLKKFKPVHLKNK